MSTLLIVVNPFAAPLGEKGHATALCPVDPKHPSGREYIGAKTVAKAIERSAQDARRMASPFTVKGVSLTRDKVTVNYDLRPIQVPDSSFYRKKIKAGEAFLALEVTAQFTGPASISVSGKSHADVFVHGLRDAAWSALTEYTAAGGSRSEALASWRTQGLAQVADMIEATSKPHAGPQTEQGAEPVLHTGTKPETATSASSAGVA